MVKNQRTWIEISGAALRHNLKAMQSVVGNSVSIMPIVKANAYGHGFREVLQALRRQPHWGIGVAYGEEALQARALNYRGRILVLSNWQTAELPELIRKKTELVVWDEVSLEAVLNAAAKTLTKPKIHFKLDTGTTRIGFLEHQLPIVLGALRNQHIKVVGIFSHLANAEEDSTTQTKKQLIRFTTLSLQLGIAGADRGVERHIACTAAILRYPEARFGLVRLGIGLYGLSPSEQNLAWSKANLPAFHFQPALRWYTNIAQVKSISKGTGIGYGSTFRAKRAMRIGVLPIGYADGYDRRLSNNGFVIINGSRAPIIGRVCMNMTMIDVTNVPAAHSGQVVTLIGSGVSADDLARAIDSINYEVTTRINWTIPRYLI